MPHLIVWCHDCRHRATGNCQTSNHNTEERPWYFDDPDGEADHLGV